MRIVSSQRFTSVSMPWLQLSDMAPKVTSNSPGRARRVVLREPSLRDETALVAAARASRDLHGRWVTAPTTPKAFRAFVERAHRPENCLHLVVDKASGALVGVVNVTQIVMGPLRSAYLGYYAFSGFERCGLMREALALAVRHAFGKLKLHRLEANIQPENAASIALVRTCGFRLEGYSPRYLKINGRWRDHERWAITVDDVPARAAATTRPSA